MSALPKTLEKIIDSLSSLPGIGRKTAQRLGMYMMKMDDDFISEFASALVDMKDNIYSCSKCNNFCESDICNICSDPNRNMNMICVVENPSDIILFDNTGFNGSFHVLGGLLSPLDGISPEDLSIDSLISRLDGVEEVIIAIGTSVEAETTSLYLVNLLKSHNMKISRLSQGLPVGGQLEYIDQATLEKSFTERVAIN
ncbi:MAG: recombination protein RecR [Candidatus Marinimicrobia bacterium]|nr:recombination protein RecR [Candidatus Neomarinimicrobiota bacterium]|tara:strand:- start:1967 stop:2560 length:594 start_codon:yes stop_codon:yes gene_type:complete